MLDEAAAYERIDRDGMRDVIAQLPAQARKAWDEAQAWPLPPGFAAPARVVMLGMGGSAIGADVAATLAGRLSSVPVQVVRGYTAPSVDERTLVIACSYSGDTEETLEAFQGALPRAGMRLAITSGGRLARLAPELGYAVFQYERVPNAPPRAAFGYSLFPILAMLQRLGVFELPGASVEAALAQLEQCARDWGVGTPHAQNAAKQIAASLYRRLPIILGPDVLEVAARRWAGQCNENAKQWALHGALPEADHNLIVGFGAPPAALELLHVLILDSAATHPRNRLRVRLTAEALEGAGIRQDVLLIGGEEPLDAVLRACYLADWVSLYLAILNEAAPSPNPQIDRLKQALNAQA